MKTSLGIVLAFELMFALWFAFTPCILSPGVLQAEKARHNDPTSETAHAELEHAIRHVEVQRFGLAAIAFVLVSSPHLVAALFRRRELRRVPRLKVALAV